MLRGLLILWLLCLAASASAGGFMPTRAGTVSAPSGGGDFVFTPLHTYFLAPAASGGADSNDGTTPTVGGGHGPWLTPNHSVVCGDVILAATGSYSGGWQDGEWGTVNPASCPSTTGGIDGTGGIHFAILLCSGNVGTCTQNGNAFEAFRINVGRWSVQGWSGTQNANGQGGCFNGENDVTKQNYVAFINNIATGCNLDGFGMSGGGGGTNSSFDHFAAVGVVAFNAAQSISAFCGSGISPIPGNADADTQTHIYIAGYFGAYNTNKPSGCTVGGGGGHPHSDGEGVIFDTFAAGYTTSGFDKGVALRDAVIWKSGNSCIQWFPQGNGTTNDKAQYDVRNVSCYANNQDPEASCQGDVWLHGVYPSGTGNYLLINNLFVSNQRSCGGAGILTIPSAVHVEGSDESVLNPAKINISGNYIWQSAGTTTNVVGPPNTYVVDHTVGGAPIFDAPWVFGTNTYSNPGFTDPGSLFSTSPNCTSYFSVTDCMNDVSGLNVYNKIKPAVAPITMGYQPPGPCATDALYPTWLKGIVYLHASGFTVGAAITEKAGLVNKPCGL